MDFIECRMGCGACCIHISISSVIPGHPNGKPAGVRCKNLTDDYSCGIWKTPEFPAICGKFRAVTWICGNDRETATKNIIDLERLTS